MTYITTVASGNLGCVKYLSKTIVFHYFHNYHERLLPLHRENVYFHYELDLFRKCMLQRYNIETTVGDECCMLFRCCIRP